MTRFRNNFIFIGLSLSAYISPLLMIVSILTSRWLFSFERVPKDQMNEYAALFLTTTTTKSVTSHTVEILSNLTQATTTTTTTTVGRKSSTQRKIYIEAAFGLWSLCSVSMNSRELDCNSVTKFDVDNKVTDSLKKQIRDCILPLMFALLIMIVAVLLHTYALMYKYKLYYMLLLSGCLFIFAGLLTLTGLIFFISAVNGAIDNKYSSSKTNDDEAQFSYKYGFSFYCCIISFLLQEFNGIFNVIWYIDYFRKYRHKIKKESEIESLPERFNIKKQRAESFKSRNSSSVISSTFNNNNNNQIPVLSSDFKIGFSPDKELERRSSTSLPVLVPDRVVESIDKSTHQLISPGDQLSEPLSSSPAPLETMSNVRVIKVNAKCDCMSGKKPSTTTGNEFLFKKALFDASAALFQYLTRQREDSSSISLADTATTVRPRLTSQLDHIPTYCIEKSNDYQPLTRYVVENNIFVVKNVSGHQAFVNIGKKSLKRTTSV